MGTNLIPIGRESATYFDWESERYAILVRPVYSYFKLEEGIVLFATDDIEGNFQLHELTTGISVGVTGKDYSTVVQMSIERAKRCISDRIERYASLKNSWPEIQQSNFDYITLNNLGLWNS